MTRLVYLLGQNRSGPSAVTSTMQGWPGLVWAMIEVLLDMETNIFTAYTTITGRILQEEIIVPDA